MAKHLFLTVKEVITETPNTKTISFWQPIHDTLKYEAGQFLTVIVTLDGVQHRRSYSMSSSPREPQIAITVKQLSGGLVSAYLCQNIQPGQVLEVLEPLGNFKLSTAKPTGRSAVFVAGGSGITPIYSMLCTLLAAEAQAHAYLVYGSKNEENIIFKKQLDQLEQQYPNRLKVLHVLTEPSYTWTGYKTRINQASMVIFLKQNLNVDIINSEYYLCGPEGMMQQVENALNLFNVTSSNIFKEHFSSGIVAEHSLENNEVLSQNYTVTLIYEGKTYTINVAPHQTILEAGLEADIDLPYSCQAGMCTACMGLCKTGAVKMDEEDGLTDTEIAQGYVLTCVSHPHSANVVIDFD
jgi:ring-1,2-phenylacetyl-CoA epoxidase subunit PaaE